MRDGDNRLSEPSSLNAPLWARWKKNQSPGGWEKSVQMEEPSADWPWLRCRACVPKAKTSHRMATPTRWIKIYALLTLAPSKVTRINCARIRPSGCQHLAMTWTKRPSLAGRACCGCAAPGCPCAARAPRIADTWSLQSLQQEIQKNLHYISMHNESCINMSSLMEYTESELVISQVWIQIQNFWNYFEQNANENSWRKVSNAKRGTS
jgi:hypothetical protein